MHGFFDTLQDVSLPIHSEPSSIAVAFTPMSRAIVSADGTAAWSERHVVAESITIIGPEPRYWLRTSDPVECLELVADNALRTSVAAELNVAWSSCLDDRWNNLDPFIWSAAVRLRSFVRGTLILSDIQRDMFVRLIYARSLKQWFGGSEGRRGDGEIGRRGLTRILEFVEAHCAEELSIERLAEVAGLSPFHFLRSFRRSTGWTPMQYVRARRLERARAMLRSGESIENLLSYMGYRRRDRFKSDFLRHFGHETHTDLAFDGVNR